MALVDIRQFVFYFKYLWSPADFLNMQTWLQSEYRAIAEGGFGASILSGIKASVSSGLTVSMTNGIAVNSDGRIVVFVAANATFASPAGNPARSLLVLRPKLTSANFIPEPVNPANSVPLHQKLEYDLVVINGTPAATPVYPSTVAGDIVVLGVSLTASQVTLVATNFDREPIDIPRKRIHGIRTIVSSVVTGNVKDSTIDANANANTITYVLPDSQLVPGEDFTVTKIDSSVNEVAVSGAGGRLISGETLQYLETQWATMTFRSVGSSWRIL